MSTGHEPAPFELHVLEVPELSRVSSFEGVEEVSRPYRIEIRALTESHDEDLPARLLDRRASLVLHGGDGPGRLIHGILTRAAAEGTFLHGRQALTLRLAPALHRLKRRRARRIFQDRTTLDIASELLAEHHVPFQIAAHGDPHVRGYTVQYDETDLAFLTRLFAEDGLFYFFDHPPSPGAPEVLVIADSVQGYRPIAGHPELRFERVLAASGLSPREDQVTSFVLAKRARPRRVTSKGYDFRRPGADLREEASSLPDPLALTSEELSSIAEHEGSYERDAGRRPAGIRLEQERRNVEVAEATSSCRRALPGARFSLRGHDLAALDRAWAVTRVEHEGYSAEVVPRGRDLYQCRFRCVPDHVAMRPSYRPPPPRQVAETAVVVGPPGKEIYTDVHGRIKVAFHWDARAEPGRASCWLRVAQAWAGAGWGAQFIPRVGMEVVVTFLGGDLDRPLVTGCVYNATHTPPFPVPQAATRSGIRTQSVPAGVGANELSFEDAAGEEQIYLHAQRDYDELIERHRTSRVRGGSGDSISGSSEIHVGEDARLTVDRDRTTRIQGQDRLVVGKGRDVEVAADSSLRVTGMMSTKVLGGHILEVRGGAAVIVGADDDRSQSEHTVYGSASTWAQERLTLRAEQGISLVCGEAKIELLPDKIVLHAPQIEVTGKDGVAVSTKDGPSIKVGDGMEILSKNLRVFTESAALELDKEAKINGDKIKLGYQPQKPENSSEDEEPETQTIQVKLTDWFMSPYAKKKYHLLTRGLRFEGETDGDGGLRVDVPKEAKQATIRLWLRDYPEGPTRVYQITLGEVPPVDDAKGAEQRLKNMGYYEGPVGRGMNADLRAAIREFQADHADSHGLEPTGELDEGTAGAIEEIHGS